MPAADTAAPAAPAAVLEHRFAALRAYPTFDELCAYDPRATASSLGLYSQTTSGLVLIAIGVAATIGFSFAGGPAALIGLPIVVFGAFVTRKGIGLAAKFDKAPLEAFPATLLGDRVKVSGGGEESSAHTAYFATLQNSDGDRKEYQVTETVASKAFAGDIGIGYVKGDHLVEFIVVPV